jgi:hypothetical protein
MMGDDAKQVLIGADPDSASAEDFAPAASLKTWVTPKVIVSNLDGTKLTPGTASDATNHGGSFSS